MYAFCRWADDLGDEVHDPDRAVELLAERIRSGDDALRTEIIPVARAASSKDSTSGWVSRGRPSEARLFTDGTTWSSFLRDSCVHDLALAPDGSAWVQADVEAGSWNSDAWDVGLYVITPEAVASVE